MKYLQKEIKSFACALKGIVKAIGKERHLKFHLFASLLVVIFAIVLDVCIWEWIALLLCIGFVIALELINTALESVINLLHPSRHPLAGYVKDVAAGAVLVMAFVAAIVALLIFGPKLWWFCKASIL